MLLYLSDLALIALLCPDLGDAEPCVESHLLRLPITPTNPTDVPKTDDVKAVDKPSDVKTSTKAPIEKSINTDSNNETATTTTTDPPNQPPTTTNKPETVTSMGQPGSLPPIVGVQDATEPESSPPPQEPPTPPSPLTPSPGPVWG